MKTLRQRWQHILFGPDTPAGQLFDIILIAAMMAFDSSGSSSNSNKTSADSFWVNAMEQWWKSVRSDSTIENEALFEKVIDQCHDYYFMSEQFSGLIEGMMNAKDKNEDVKRFINKKFKEIESMLSATQTNFSWGSIIDDCEQSFEFIKTSLFLQMFSVSYYSLF